MMVSRDCSSLVLLLKQSVNMIFFFLPQFTQGLAYSVFPHLALSPDTLSQISPYIALHERFFPSVQS